MLTGNVICPTKSNGAPLAPIEAVSPAVAILSLDSLVRALKNITDAAAPKSSRKVTSE